MKRIYLFFVMGAIVFFGLVGVTLSVIKGRAKKIDEHEVHYHAGFQIYLDGQKQDFSSIRYMSLQPCGEEKHDLTPEEEQLEKAHLHEKVGDVAHVHQDGATWGDLIKNIKFLVDPAKEIRAYHGENEEIKDILNSPITANDSIVIVIGDQSSASAYLKEKVTTDHIKEVEKTSELCGTSES